MPIRDYAAWLFLFAIALLLIVAGFQGSFGRMVAVAVCPAKLEVSDGTNSGTF